MNKKGRAIIKLLEELKKREDIISYDVNDKDVEYIEINIKVNEICDLRVYNNINQFTNKTFEWVLEYGEDGSMEFYGTEKSQALMCKVIEDRATYGNRMLLRRYANKYQNLDSDILTLALAHRDIKIKELEKKIKQNEELISKLIKEA